MILRLTNLIFFFWTKFGDLLTNIYSAYFEIIIRPTLTLFSQILFQENQICKLIFPGLLYLFFKGNTCGTSFRSKKFRKIEIHIFSFPNVLHIIYIILSWSKLDWTKLNSFSRLKKEECERMRRTCIMFEKKDVNFDFTIFFWPLSYDKADKWAMKILKLISEPSAYRLHKENFTKSKFMSLSRTFSILNVTKKLIYFIPI